MFHHHHHHHGNQQAYEAVYTQPHQGHLSHELIGGAAAFAAMREYERRQPGGGNHAMAKEILAALVAAEMDKLIETKGLDYIDRQRAHQHAQQQADQMFHHEYVSGQGSGGQFFQQYGGGPGADMGYRQPGYGAPGGYGGYGGMSGGPMGPQAGYGGPMQAGPPQMGYGGPPQMGYGGSPQMGYGGPPGAGYGNHAQYGGPQPPRGW